LIEVCYLESEVIYFNFCLVFFQEELFNICPIGSAFSKVFHALPDDGSWSSEIVAEHVVLAEFLNLQIISLILSKSSLSSP
jgi:hypothetical protein